MFCFKISNKTIITEFFIYVKRFYRFFALKERTFSMDKNLSFSLDERLLTVASLCPSGKAFADIGTDHAMVPAFLIKKKNCPFGFASDINEMPLKKALSLTKKEGLEDKLSLFLFDGIPMEARNFAETIIIAGLGGETIAKIVKDAPELWREDVHFILQPMTKIERLRKELSSLSFSLLKEVPCYSMGKSYSVMDWVFSKGSLQKSKDELFLMFGDYLTRESLTKKDSQYLSFVFKKYERILGGLLKSKEEKDRQKGKRLKENLQKARESFKEKNFSEEK